MKKIIIENCEFKYKCPNEYKNLDKSKDDPGNVRFCNQCEKNVYKCIFKILENFH